MKFLINLIYRIKNQLSYRILPTDLLSEGFKKYMFRTNIYEICGYDKRKDKDIATDNKKSGDTA